MLIALMVGLSLAGAPVKAPDITGTWVPIGEHEADQGRIRVNGCWSHRTTWVVAVEEGKVVATLKPGHSTSGARRVDVYRHHAVVTGSWTGDSLKLVGPKTVTHTMVGQPTFKEITEVEQRFAFNLDAKSGHLVGTLNDRAVRWAPADTRPQSKQSCGAPPP